MDMVVPRSITPPAVGEGEIFMPLLWNTDVVYGIRNVDQVCVTDETQYSRDRHAVEASVLKKLAPSLNCVSSSSSFPLQEFG